MYKSCGLCCCGVAPQGLPWLDPLLVSLPQHAAKMLQFFSWELGIGYFEQIMQRMYLWLGSALPAQAPCVFTNTRGHHLLHWNTVLVEPCNCLPDCHMAKTNKMPDLELRIRPTFAYYPHKKRDLELKTRPKITAQSLEKKKDLELRSRPKTSVQSPKKKELNSSKVKPALEKTLKKKSQHECYGKNIDLG